MGITTVSLMAARDHAPSGSTSAIGTMTTVFGFGQMVGPALAGGPQMPHMVTPCRFSGPEY